MAKVGPIAHLFSKDVGWIYFPSDVKHIKGLVVHPFTNEIFSELNMSSSLGSHVVQPFGTGIIVVEEKSWRINISEGMTRLRNASTKVAKVKDFLRSGVSGTNFDFTRTERSAVLLFTEPTKWATSLDDNAAVHTMKLEERQESTISNHGTNLRTPTCIAVSRSGGRICWSWRDGIFVCFNIG
jgi:hypothetical protein